MMNNFKKTRAILIFCAISSMLSAHSYAQTAASNQSQIVTIMAKRLSAQEKQKYDQEQVNHKIQQVIISAKRLDPQDKMAERKHASQ